MSDNEVDYYKILGLGITSDRGTIWNAFRNIGTKYIPDEESDNL
jgi:DnaJ-class molecular chaperone